MGGLIGLCDQATPSGTFIFINSPIGQFSSVDLVCFGQLDATELNGDFEFSSFLSLSVHL